MYRPGTNANLAQGASFFSIAWHGFLFDMPLSSRRKYSLLRISLGTSEVIGRQSACYKLSFTSLVTRLKSRSMKINSRCTQVPTSYDPINLLCSIPSSSISAFNEIFSHQIHQRLKDCFESPVAGRINERNPREIGASSNSSDRKVRESRKECVRQKSRAIPTVCPCVRNLHLGRSNLIGGFNFSSPTG